MLPMCEPVFSTGKCVVLDSGSCVSKGITALLDFVVYADALIKKQKYWPRGVPGDAIDKYFSDKDATYVDMLEAITEEGPEGKAFKVLFQGSRVFHEDYCHLYDTGRVGWSRYWALIQGAGW